jgi:hypothetical protein
MTILSKPQNVIFIYLFAFQSNILNLNLIITTKSKAYSIKKILLRNHTPNLFKLKSTIVVNIQTSTMLISKRICVWKREDALAKN